jgi:hypothetical protein
MRKYAAIIALQVVFAQIVAMSSAAADKIEKVGSWTYKTLEDKMNDKVRYIAALQISDGALVIKCDERGPHSIYISIVMSKYLGGNFDARRLDYRVDKTPAVQDSWSYNSQSANLLDNSRALALANEIGNASSILIRAYTYQYDTVDAEFDVRNSKAIVQRVIHDCQSRN